MFKSHLEKTAEEKINFDSESSSEIHLNLASNNP